MKQKKIRTARGWSHVEVFAIGHSTQPIEDFIEKLLAFKIHTLVDIRTIPQSRYNPQFNSNSLSKSLKRVDILYVHVPRLGGLRKSIGETSPNKAWRNKSFRGFADYMQTADFREGLEELKNLSKEGPVAIMCAEGFRWRCHRSLVADALWAHGVIVKHIENKTRVASHSLTPFAQLRGRNVIYPTDTAKNKISSEE
jgi:uncharacterized protein (DUF488 family)